MAPPTRLTPELAAYLVRLLRDGATVEAAARACGVGRRTVYDLARTRVVWARQSRWTTFSPDALDGSSTFDAP